MGGHREVVMRRAARLADGWMWSGNIRPDAAAQATVDTVHQLVRAAGRDPAAFGIEGRVALARLEPDHWAGEIAAWRAMRGVSHLSVDTMRIGLTKPDQHIEALRRFKEAARV
jgi:alkanesulfonate monooxygenase SsuD/methylene tetrahydromethanopterin reductase-like flavin-dependent oxidoreductase (luciferase family)